MAAGSAPWSVRSLALAVALAVLASLLALPGTADAVDDHGFPAPPSTVGDVGPHAVGHTTILVDVDHRAEPLPVDVWYPADDTSAGEAAALTYDFEIDLGLLAPGGELLSFALPSPFGTVEPAVADGEFPLVVFSHGNGGTRFQSFFLTERLASFGFVVVSPDHLGNTFTDLLGDDPTDPEIVAAQRPLDVSGLIDAALAGDIAPDLLGDAIDAEQVAVTGHSFGGYTALAAAGGNALVDVDPDPRIDAIVPLAPAVFPQLLTDEQLEAMTVPTLFIGGTLDSTTPIEPNIGRATALMASDPLYRLDIADAGHFTFSDVCAIADAVAAEVGPVLAGLLLPELPGYPETCDGQRLSPSIAHPLIARATAGFLIEQIGDGVDPTDVVGAPPFADALIGDYAIGKTTVEVAVPHRDADLPVEVWYPADATSAAAADDALYSLSVPFGASSITLTQPSPLAKDEPAVAGDATFPLVVFSHGSGGVRFQSLFLAEALASHGYVVLAPDHLGNTFADGLLGTPGNPVFDRPRDVSALIDAAVARQIAPDLLGRSVDTDRVAVSGHSFGGYTSLAVAAGNPAIDFDADPRIDAIVPIAPASGPALLADEVIEGLTTPTFFLGGTADTVTPIAPNIDRVIGLMASEVVYRLDVEDAGHYSFSDVCDFADAIADQAGPLAGLILGILPGFPESCDGTLRDITEVQDLTILSTVGFLDEQLGGPGGPPTTLVYEPPPFTDQMIGDFEVGIVTREVAVPHRAAPLTVDVLYPADADSAATADPFTYRLELAIEELDLDVSFEQQSPLGLDGPDLAAGAHPVIVFSHGLGGLRFQSQFLTEALASHGFVVVSPDHTGTTFREGLDGSLDPIQGLVNRPQDVSALIDAIESGDLAGDVLEGRASTEQVGVTGHSFGGYTTLAVATGRPAAGFEADPRVAALAPLAPATVAPLLLNAELERITQPVLLIGGTADDVTPIDPHVTRPWELLGSEVRYRMDLENAGHYTFANVCEFADALVAQLPPELVDEFLPELPGWPETCDGTLVDTAIAHPEIARATTGFFLDTIEAPELPEPPQPVDFPDVLPGNVHRDAILTLAAEGILLGGQDGLFRPRDSVTRGQLASTLARTIGLEPVVPTRFPDAVGSVHEGAIEALADSGIIAGYPDGTFRPGQPISREQIAVMLARWLEVEPVATGPFTDIGGSPYRGEINALAELGVIRGTSDTTFSPRGQLQRDQLASLIVRARPLAPANVR